MKRTALGLVLVAVMALLGGCGGDDNGGVVAVPGDDTGGDTGDTSGGGGGVEACDDHITVVIDSGANAGTYERTGNARCTVGLVGPDGLGIQYSESSLTEGLTSVQSVVPNFSGGPVTEFSAQATIGPFVSGGTAYNVVPGTATVADGGGDDVTLTVEGDTDQGSAIRIEVDCAAVQRF